jgi:hypothetical protein
VELAKEENEIMKKIKGKKMKEKEIKKTIFMSRDLYHTVTLLEDNLCSREGPFHYYCPFGQRMGQDAGSARYKPMLHAAF